MLYRKHQKQFRFRQFKPCPYCWRGRAHGRHALGRTSSYPMPKPFKGWAYAVVDENGSGRYRIRCLKCGHTTAWTTAVGAIREWNGTRDQWS